MLEAISKVKDAECTVVSSRKRENAQALADKHGIRNIEVSFEALLSRRDVDTIYLASPNSLHVRQCLESIAAGKNVICEKPLALSEREAREVFQAAREKGVFVFEAISTLFMPAYRELYAKIDSLGKPNALVCRYTQRSSRLDAFLRGEQVNVFDPAMKGGALNDLGVYAIHAIVGLLGSPKSVSYSPVFGENGVDLAGTLTMDYGAFKAEAFCAKDRDAGSSFRIDCEHGSISENGPLNSFSNCELQSAEGVNTISNQGDALNNSNQLVYELEAFQNAIQKKNQSFFELMARQSIVVAYVLEEAGKSIRFGQAALGIRAYRNANKT